MFKRPRLSQKDFNCITPVSQSNTHTDTCTHTHRGFQTKTARLQPSLKNYVFLNAQHIISEQTNKQNIKFKTTFPFWQGGEFSSIISKARVPALA